MEYAGMDNELKKIDVFPAYIKTADRSIVVVGNGREAAAKLRLVSETSADLVAVASNPSAELLEVIRLTGALHLEKEFSFEDIVDAALVFTAQELEAQDLMVVEAAHLVGVPVNAVDRPELCDFITPSIVNRAPVVVAVSTNGTAPVLARRIKASIERLLPSRTGALARLAGRLRSRVEASKPAAETRRLFWERFFDGAPARFGFNGDIQAAENSALSMLKDTDNKTGYVSLVGAGPGAEDLMTLRAQRVLQDADVVLHDALVPAEIIRMSRRDAEIISVGKRKNCHSKTQKRPVYPAILAGVKGKCPNCVDGSMFGKWLKVEHACSSCGEELHHEQAQDFPPYITLMIVGHVVVTLLMVAEAQFDLSLTTHLLIWIPLAFGMSLAMMQPVKGGVVGLQWALRMFGFGDDPEDD